MATTKKKIFSKITGKEIFLPNSPKPKSEVGVTKLKTEPIAETITKPFTGSPIINKPVGDAMPPLSAEGLENEQIALAEAEKQKARDLFAGNEFTANQEIADEFGLGLSKSGEKLFASTLEEEIARRKKAQDESTSFLTEQQQLQREQEQAQLRQLQTSGESQAASVAASLTPGREGFVGGTAKEGISQFKQLIAEKIDLAGGRLRMAENSRAQQMKELKAAQDAGDKQLVQSIRQGIAVAEQEITKNKAALIDAQVQANEQALKIAQFESAESRANFDSFQTLVETGIDLDANALIGLSTRMNIPADIVNGVYQGMDFIRKDKSLSLAEKQVGYEQELNKLRDYQLGLSSKEAKKVDDFMKIVNSGTRTPEELQSFAIAMDIPNDKNPVFLVDQQLKALELDIKTKQSQGIPTSISEYQELIKLQQQQNEFYGVGGEALIPKGSKEGFKVTYEGGGLVINQEGGFKPYQCGAFVNRVWGLEGGGSVGFGNTSKSKTDIVDARGIKSEDVNLMNYKSVLKPGMAFVLNGGTTGHVGIITAIGEDGRFSVMEANVGSGSNSGPGTIPTTTTKSIQDGAIYGYAPPPNFDVVSGKSGGEGGTFTPSTVATFNNWDGRSIPKSFDGTPDEFRAQYNKFIEARGNPNLPTKERLEYTNGNKALTVGVREGFDNLLQVSKQLDSLEAALAETPQGDLGKISNALSSVNPFSVKKREVKALITGLLPKTARGIFGEVGVLTDSDIERYAQTIPQLTDSGAQRAAVIDIMRDMLANSIDQQIKFDGATYDLTGLIPLSEKVQKIQSGGKAEEEINFDDIDFLNSVGQEAESMPTTETANNFSSYFQSLKK